MAKIRRIASNRIPRVPMVASKGKWPVVASKGEWPVVAEAGRRGKTKSKKRKASDVHRRLAQRLGLKGPPSKKGKKRKRVTRKSVARGVSKGRGTARGATGMPEFIQRVPVASSNVASIGYDAPSMLLEVEFLSGAIYRYYNVSESVWTGFRRASSKGRYVWRSLRNYGADDAYTYSRVE